MYFVDRKKIEETLAYIESLQAPFEEIKPLQSKVERLALERIAQGWVEAIIDVGNQMIDGFIMRDPGSYIDIIDILWDEKVVTKENADQLKAIIGLRKLLVQSYTTIDHAHFLHVLTKNHQAIKEFPQRVQAYLDEELGPVSAFLPDDKE